MLYSGGLSRIRNSPPRFSERTNLSPRTSENSHLSCDDEEFAHRQTAETIPSHMIARQTICSLRDRDEQCRLPIIIILERGLTASIRHPGLRRSSSELSWGQSSMHNGHRRIELRYRR